MLLVVVLSATPAAASDWWFFKSHAQRLLEDAQEARREGNIERAEELLAAAEREMDKPLPAIAYERGLIARDHGKLDEALDLLKRAADADAESDARIDMASVLVDLGRWPDAVAALRQAADERGSSFPVDALSADARFAKLRSFQPYQELIDQARIEQAGPIGRMLLRLERLEESARSIRETFDELALAIRFVSRIFDAVSASLVAFVLLGLLITFGVKQLGLLHAPWTLVLGMLIDSLLWSWGARVATVGESHGTATIGAGLAVVFIPWLAVALGRFAVQRFMERRTGPFAPRQLATTLALMDSVSLTGRRLLEASPQDKARLEDELIAAKRALYARLRIGSSLR